jgi:hypothetical protein
MRRIQRSACVSGWESQEVGDWGENVAKAAIPKQDRVNAAKAGLGRRLSKIWFLESLGWITFF